MEINRTVPEIEDMLRRVCFAIDATPEVDLLGRNNLEMIRLMESHRTILRCALVGEGFPQMQVLFDQTCLSWLSGCEWKFYPKLEKSKEGVWQPA